MELVIFHYHVLPGGVTDVIRHMVASISTHLSAVNTIRLVTGAEPDQIDLPPSVHVERIPNIGYVSKERLAGYAESSDSHNVRSGNVPGPVGRVSREEVTSGTEILARHIAQELLSRYGNPETVWWVHNYHLGKNPAFTKALLHIAATHREQRIVFHIHDFPESGRYGNLRLLRDAGVGPLYPDHPNLQYVTINSRDRDVLVNAGVRKVTYLPNPVRIPAPTDRGNTELVYRDAVRERLAASFGETFFRFHPTDRVFLYPVRSIRRKNVLEAGLVTLLQDEPSSLIVTLPGVSHQEKKYSAMVEHAFQDGTIPGLFGIGTSIEDIGIDFPSLLASADVIISSSVQEGFGYQYITPLQLGLPLVAREIDVMADVSSLYREYPHSWYRSIRVPSKTPSLSGPLPLLKFRYEEKIERLHRYVPEDVVAQLLTEIDTVLSDESLEFSYLMPHMQYVVLQDVHRDPVFRAEVATLNGDFLLKLKHVLQQASITPTKPPLGAIKDAFGPESFSRKLEHILRQFTEQPVGLNDLDTSRGDTPFQDPEPHDSDGVTDNLLRSFGKLEFQRLIYE